MKYVIIKNNKVENIIEADAKFALSIGAIAHEIGTEIGDTYANGAFNKPLQTPEQLLATWKQERELLVSQIEVTYNSIVYQADETSRGRMSVAISVMDNIDTQYWTAKDNSVQSVIKADLIAIVKDGNAQQTAIWNSGRPS